MGMIGSFGTVVFRVSASEIETIRNVVRSQSAQYATHQRHGTSALTEFVGVNPETLTFDMDLSVYLGISPKAEISKLKEYLQTGATVPLVMGGRIVGKYRWTVQSLKISEGSRNRNGILEQATVSVSLLEYLKK